MPVVYPLAALRSPGLAESVLLELPDYTAYQTDSAEKPAIKNRPVLDILLPLRLEPVRKTW